MPHCHPHSPHTSWRPPNCVIESTVLHPIVKIRLAGRTLARIPKRATRAELRNNVPFQCREGKVSKIPALVLRSDPCGPQAHIHARTSRCHFTYSSRTSHHSVVHNCNFLLVFFCLLPCLPLFLSLLSLSFISYLDVSFSASFSFLRLTGY